MTEHDEAPPAQVEHERRRPRAVRVIMVLRSIAIVAAAIAAWGWYAWAVQSIGEAQLYRYEYAFLASLSVVLLVATIIWGWSIRSARLRTALRAIDVGVLVALVVYLSTLVFPDDDPLSGQEFYAVGCGIVAALIASIALPMFAGRRSGALPLAGVLATVTLLAIAGPHALSWAERGELADASYLLEYQQTRLASYFDEDGVRLVSGQAAYTTSVADGYEPHATNADQGGGYGAPVGVVGDGSAVATPSVDAQPGAVAAQASPLGQIDVRAVSGGTIELAVRLGQTDGGPLPLAASVRRGTCVGGSGAELSTFDLVDHRVVKTELPLTLDQLTARPDLILLVGEPKALGRVRCIDLVDRTAVALASTGGLEFLEDCIEPLGLVDGQLGSLSAASFQDSGCATEYERLARIATGSVVDREDAAAVRACLREAGASSDAVEELEGGGIAIAAATGGDVEEDVLRSRCSPNDPAGIAYMVPSFAVDPALGQAEPFPNVIPGSAYDRIQ